MQLIDCVNKRFSFSAVTHALIINERLWAKIHHPKARVGTEEVMKKSRQPLDFFDIILRKNIKNYEHFIESILWEIVRMFANFSFAMYTEAKFNKKN